MQRETPKNEDVANVLDLRLCDLVLTAESCHSVGGLADVHKCGRPIPATGVLRAGCLEEVDLFAYLRVQVLHGWRSPRVVGAAESAPCRRHGLGQDTADMHPCTFPFS
jgi:hypothetical protein